MNRLYDNKPLIPTNYKNQDSWSVLYDLGLYDDYDCNYYSDEYEYEDCYLDILVIGLGFDNELTFHLTDGVNCFEVDEKELRYYEHNISEKALKHMEAKYPQYLI